MTRQGRPVDQNFRQHDLLYHRCVKDDVLDGRMIASRIRIENPSVNWSKYSKPWDVVFDYPGCGIVRFVVRDLPYELPEGNDIPKGTKTRWFQPSHEPEELNYSHSEIATFSDGERMLKPSHGKIVKKQFQMKLHSHSLVILDPKK